MATDPVVAARGSLGAAVQRGDAEAIRAAKIRLAHAKADKLRAQADALVASAGNDVR